MQLVATDGVACVVSVCQMNLSVCLSLMIMSPAKMAELTEILTHVGLRNHVLYAVPDPQQKRRIWRFFNPLKSMELSAVHKQQQVNQAAKGSSISFLSIPA